MCELKLNHGHVTYGLKNDKIRKAVNQNQPNMHR